MKPLQKSKIGLMPAMAELYYQLWPGLDKQYKDLLDDVKRSLHAPFDFHESDIVSTESNATRCCKEMLDAGCDLLVVVMAPYCPSGCLWKALSETTLPILLWPLQSTERVNPDTFSIEDIKLSHGVHAVQDLGNILQKKGVPFGVLHKHYEQPGFNEKFARWAQAATVYRAFVNSNPIQVGGHFENMLDLQIGSEPYLEDLNLQPQLIENDAFVKEMLTVEECHADQVSEVIKRYNDLYTISDEVTESMLQKAARGEVALRRIMEARNSKACGLNFLNLCDDPRIADGLHVAGSTLMADGFGYAAEGDWVTASFVYALQRAFGVASFTEMFSVSYPDNRIILRHWGEGNPRMARSKPLVSPSQFTHNNTAEFLVTNLEFSPGPATLINLNSTPDGQGQIISLQGNIVDVHLSRTDGPRAVFQPAENDVEATLDSYVYAGGSHHLVLLNGHRQDVVLTLGRLVGWKTSVLT